MKKLIFAVFENKHGSEEVLTELSHAGFNGTVIPSTSLRHTLLSGGEVPMFFTAAHLDVDKFENNTSLFLIVEEEKVPEVRKIIREITEDFTAAKGAMVVIPLEEYEGSF